MTVGRDGVGKLGSSHGCDRNSRPPLPSSPLMTSNEVVGEIVHTYLDLIGCNVARGKGGGIRHFTPSLTCSNQFKLVLNIFVRGEAHGWNKDRHRSRINSARSCRHLSQNNPQTKVVMFSCTGQATLNVCHQTCSVPPETKKT